MGRRSPITRSSKCKRPILTTLSSKQRPSMPCLTRHAHTYLSIELTFDDACLLACLLAHWSPSAIWRCSRWIQTAPSWRALSLPKSANCQTSVTRSMWLASQSEARSSPSLKEYVVQRKRREREREDCLALAKLLCPPRWCLVLRVKPMRTLCACFWPSQSMLRSMLATLEAPSLAAVR